VGGLLAAQGTTAKVDLDHNQSHGKNKYKKAR
jgi:hypothetical protein